MTKLKTFLDALLHSYSLLFFSQHRGFGALLLLATLLNPTAGVAGLAAAGLAVGLARAGGFSRELTQVGAYSFNALLVGLALGTFYGLGGAFWLVLAVGTGLALLLAVALNGWLGQRGLPALSGPFVLTLWLLLPTAELLHLTPNESGIYWLNEAYALGGERLVRWWQTVGDWCAAGPWVGGLGTYLRALSAVLFQDSVAAGALAAAGLLWHSRMAFSLTVLAYVAAQALAWATGGGPGSLAHYDLGANYMMAVLAVGGVFLVPTWRAYAVALATVPVSAVLVVGLGKVLGGAGLPVFSLPFCAVALLALYCLLLRTAPGRLPLTPYQHYSPEQNLYAFRNQQARQPHPFYQPLRLPFRGEWRVSQGYADGPTHQGEWAAALDFMIADADGRTYHGPGTALADYYCYDKPVLAAAAGTVEVVLMHIPDNPIGHNNTAQNWGNTIIVRHAAGLYSALSHLRPGSAQVQAGDFVQAGDVLAACGSSGRSAEPHLHFQVQTTPVVGARPLAYPLAQFLRRTATSPAARLASSAVPALGEIVAHPEPSALLRQAFDFLPGAGLTVRAADAPELPAQHWECLTDAYNHTYLRCHATGAVAYFERTDTAFYFTAYYGSRRAWLYAFYLAAYRVPLTYLPADVVRDTFPLTVVGRPLWQWAQDVVAPFFTFMRAGFELRYDSPDNPYHPRAMRLRSRATVRVGRQIRQVQEAELVLSSGALAGFTARRKDATLTLLCSSNTA